MPTWRPLSALGLIWSLAACDSCTSKPAPSMSPTRFVDEQADGVVEIRDLEVLVRAKAKAVEHLGRVVTREQLRILEHELELSLGFDPTTAEGLEKAGLRRHASIAIQLADGGRSALWVVPIADAGVFTKTVDRIVRSRATVDEVQPFDTEAGRGQRFIAQFGPRTIVVAATATYRDHALIGVGRQAEALVVRALEVVKAEASSIEAHPAYARLTEELGRSWELRFVAPRGRQVLSRLIAMTGELLPDVQALGRLELSRVQSVGGAVDFRDMRAVVRGRIELDPEGRSQVQRVFAAPVEEPGPVVAIDVPEAVVYVQAAGQAASFLEVAFPPGSPGRDRVVHIFTRVNRMTGVDVPVDLIPFLDGHAALSLGLRDLTGVALGALRSDPWAALWVTASAGFTNPRTVKELQARIEPRLTEQSIVKQPREVEGRTIQTWKRTESSRAFAETLEQDRAWIVGTEPRVMDEIARFGSAKASTARKTSFVSPGLLIEVRFQALSRALDRLRLGVLPLLYRSILGKALDLIRILDRAVLHVRPAVDGIEVDGELSLAGAGSAS